MKASVTALAIGRYGGSVTWIRDYWKRLHQLAGGRQLYSHLLGRIIPYTGTIRATVSELRPGFAQVQMRDRRALHNHLGSLHAIALSNLAELTGNAALAYSLPSASRFIVSKMQMEYVKKAHGPITAECRCEIPETNQRATYLLQVELRDASGSIVARSELTTLVGPVSSHQ